MSTMLAKEAPEKALRPSLMAPLSIFEEMDRLAAEIEKKAFSLFQQRGGSDGFALSDWFRAESEFLHPTPIEVKEDEKEVVIKAEVPGFELKELSISAEPYGIRIYGKSEKREQEKKEEKKGTVRHYSEISGTEVLRQVSLPAAINPENATARLEKGVLEIHLPKAAPPKLIEIKSAA
ncbi:MAG TPA: Hsp20/alpha crystallin family protein [Acidobacteriaceae bacterium]|nr:Hsp20/alpha crystallin family protein [Acidobacteriaceae bacterium]